MKPHTFLFYAVLALALLPMPGKAGVNLHACSGWGSVTHWNVFVANLEMGGRGMFYDPRLADAETFPVAARNGFWNVRHYTKGGFYRDGRFATLADVVNHYDCHLNIGLTDAKKADLAEYLKSL